MLIYKNVPLFSYISMWPKCTSCIPFLLRYWVQFAVEILLLQVSHEILRRSLILNKCIQKISVCNKIIAYLPKNNTYLRQLWHILKVFNGTMRSVLKFNRKLRRQIKFWNAKRKSYFPSTNDQTKTWEQHYWWLSP